MVALTNNIQHRVEPASIPSQNTRRKLEIKMLVGSIDVVGHVVKGWACDTDEIEGCVVDVVINGRKIFSFIAGNDQRPDVAAALTENLNKPVGECGFVIDLSARLTHQISEVEFRFNKSGKIIGEKFYARLPQKSLSVLEGTDGYKFFIGDRKEFLRQLSGDVLPTQENIDSWVNMYCLLSTATGNHGGIFIAVACPDKLAVAPHIVSSDLVISEERSINKISQIMQRLYGLDIVYPLDKLAGKMRYLTKTDSHLSWRAHFEIFKLMLEQLPTAPVLTVPRWVPTPIMHDLSLFDETFTPEIEDMPKFIKENDIIVLRNPQSNVTIHINKNAEVPLALLCGHSSCAMMAIYMRQIARTTIVFNANALDLELVAQLKPNLVVHYLNERVLFGHNPAVSIPASQIEKRIIARALDLSHRLAQPKLDAHTSEMMTEAMAATSLVDASVEAKTIAAKHADATGAAGPKAAPSADQMSA